MNSHRYVRVVSLDGLCDESTEPHLETARDHRLTESLRNAIVRTRQWLFAQQQADGCWVGELEGDTILESEYILLQAYLGEHESPSAHKAARYILDAQLPDGGWAIYPGGDVEISASVKAYFALKLTGHDPASSDMERARAAIMQHGGADAVNSFTRFYLALLGQISYDQCPAVPPEVLLLPTWFPINIYRVSAWSRTILVPLSIMSAHRPVRRLSPQLGIAELFLRPPDQWPPLRCPGQTSGVRQFAWDCFFRGTDRLLKFLQRRGWTPLRKRAVAAAERWMIERFAGSHGLGAIYPPMIWSVVALKCLGYDDDSPELRYCREHLNGLMIETTDSIRIQPCKSPVWDTAISMRSLRAGGVPRHHVALERAADWLLRQEVRRKGDWATAVEAEPTGWCFEYANEFYPDVDDTAMVLMALRDQCCLADNESPLQRALVDHRKAASLPDARRQVLTLDRLVESSHRAICWLLTLQNRDGGWGAFDRDNDREFLCHVPFADHNAMIDPSTSDVTARVLEALGAWGYRVGNPAMDRAVAYMRRTQEVDGSWFGRWGVNYVYGTWQALTGLEAAGVSAADATIQSGANWLLSYQQSSGGWGESPDSYMHPHLRGQGPTTASQTAWAVLGLMAARLHEHPAVRRGIQYLLRAQQEDGTWCEREFTGTGFPRVFYLRYHMYPVYFPLLALSRWIKTCNTKFPQAREAQEMLAESTARR